MTAHASPNAAHAIYAPSSAHRWMTCTASAGAIAMLGAQEEGTEAAEGTAAHEEIERCYKESVARRRDPPSCLNPAHPAAYGVALVLDYVRQLPPGKFWVEQRVRLTDEIWGRCDVAHWDDAAQVLTIVDYKNGFVNVEAAENEQLLIYAAATVYTRNLPVRWIRLVVVQPNSILPVPRVKQWICDADHLFAFAQRAAAVPQGKLEFVAGEQCKYCPLFGRCPASADVLARFSVVLAAPPEQVPPAQRAIFMATKKPVEDWFKAADKAWTKDAIASGAPPGMKLVQTTKHRAWKNEDEAREFIIQAKGVKALSPPSPAQAEKMGLDVAELCDRPKGGPALAFDSDARVGFERTSAAEMFAGSVAMLRKDSAE